MKKSKWFSAAVATALLVTGGAGSILAAESTVSAAAVNNAVKTGSATWNINGTPVVLSTIDSSGYKLYSLSQVAGELGAKVVAGANGYELNDSKGLHNVQIRTGQTGYTVDGESLQFTAAPVIHNGKVYVELTKLVTALGGELDSTAATIASFARPEGQFDTLSWNAGGSLIASKSDAETALLYKFSAAPGNYELFSSDDSAAGFAVSTDQQWGAFTDENAQLQLINLNSGAIKALGSDTSVKTDLVWSADGKSIYFIQGDKQEKVAKVNVETGAISSVLADKVENKSELRVAADEKSVVYIVNVTGVAKNDADSTEDSLTVDFSGAGEQLYKLDLTVKDAKAAALTTSADNKLYPEVVGGGVVYLSADPEGNAANVLKSIAADGKASDITLSAEANWVAPVSSGLIVSGLAADGSTVIYSVTADGGATELYRTSEDVSEVAVNHDGSKLAIVIDGKVFLIQNGQAVQLTK